MDPSAALALSTPAIAILALCLQSLAFGHTLPWSILPLGVGRVLWLALSVGLLAWIWKPRILPADRLVELAGRKPVLIAFALLTLPYLAFEVARFKEFGYGLPIAHLIVLVAILPAVRLERLWLSFLLSVLLLVASILHFPLHPFRSDMLPVIQKGLDLWKSGHSPYEIFPMAGHPNWMSYLPGTLFSHLPAWFAGIDLRWNTVIMRVLWMGLVLRLLRGRSAWAEKTGVLAALHFFALSPYLNFRHELYFEFFLVLIVMVFAFPKTRWLWFPLMFWTRQWSWMLAPFFVGAQVLRTQKVDFKESVRFLGGMILISGGFYLSLESTTTLPQVTRAIFWFQEVITRPKYSGDYGLSFSPLFFLVGASSLLQKLQGLFVLGFFGVALRELFRRGRVDWLRYAAFCWLGFLLLNPHFWLYFWISPVLFLILLPLEAADPIPLRSRMPRKSK